MPQSRYRYRSSFLNDYFPLGVKWLLIVNTAVFILYTLGGYTLQRPMIVLFGLSANAAIKSFLVWQVFTYMFLHQGVWHLLFNMLTLWMFGTQIERDMGTRRFLKYNFYCGIAAGISVARGIGGNPAGAGIGACDCGSAEAGSGGEGKDLHREPFRAWRQRH